MINRWDTDEFSKGRQLKIAKQLGYSDEVLKELEEAPNESARSRILSTA